jgi:hypothetical protein
MSGHELFQTVIGYWSQDFPLHDSSFDPDTGSFFCPSLSSAWNMAEEKTQNESEDLLVWIFYQNLHTISKQKYLDGLAHSHLSDLKESAILDQFRLAIRFDGYENLGMDII